MKLFTPDYYVESYRALDLERLKRHGIRVLVCDIDNTLAAHDEPLPDTQAIAFVRRVRDAGIQVVFISNNKRERVERFAGAVDAKCYPFARKPLKQTYRKMLRELHYAPHQVAVLGDQLLTDMLGANRMHFYTILTKPLVSRDLNCTKVNRVFEQMVFRVLERQGKIKRGEYDDKIL